MSRQHVRLAVALAMFGLVSPGSLSAGEPIEVQLAELKGVGVTVRSNASATGAFGIGRDAHEEELRGVFEAIVRASGIDVDQHSRVFLRVAVEAERGRNERSPIALLVSVELWEPAVPLRGVVPEALDMRLDACTWRRNSIVLLEGEDGRDSAKTRVSELAREFVREVDFARKWLAEERAGDPNSQ